MEIIGIHWNSLGIIGIQWNSLEFIGIQWNSLESIGIHWNSLESIGIKGNQHPGARNAPGILRGGILREHKGNKGKPARAAHQGISGVKY